MRKVINLEQFANYGTIDVEGFDVIEVSFPEDLVRVGFRLGLVEVGAAITWPLGSTIIQDQKEAETWKAIGAFCYKAGEQGKTLVLLPPLGTSQEEAFAVLKDLGIENPSMFLKQH